jgi:hypothetical protein
MFRMTRARSIAGMAITDVCDAYGYPYPAGLLGPARPSGGEPGEPGFRELIEGTYRDRPVREAVVRALVQRAAWYRKKSAGLPSTALPWKACMLLSQAAGAVAASTWPERDPHLTVRQMVDQQLDRWAYH